MVELIMYFGIGFFAAALIGLAVIPVVHNRAVRLTIRRIEAATPLAAAEAYADKDQLRAEFAISIRRLEIAIETLKVKNANQLAELGKKTSALNQLKIDLSEKMAAILALEERNKSLRDQLHSIEDNNSTDSNSVEPARLEELTHRAPDLEQELMLDLTKKQTLKSENGRLQATLSQVSAERDRLAQELCDLQYDAEERGKTVQAENALLREHINDVAAEVARLALTWEDLHSKLIPITKTIFDGAESKPVSVDGYGVVGGTVVNKTKTSLTDRIRTLSQNVRSHRNI
jgi:predicted nuclease with TOPRIM domain